MSVAYVVTNKKNKRIINIYRYEAKEQGDSRVLTKTNKPRRIKQVSGRRVHLLISTAAKVCLRATAKHLSLRCVPRIEDKICTRETQGKGAYR